MVSDRDAMDQLPMRPLWAEQAHDAGMAFFPASQHRSGATIVICPGGGYEHLAPHEGAPVARWLNTLGIDAYVLRYRLGPIWQHPAMLDDVRRAIRLARLQAPHPQRVGVLGFSAGGHLAASACTLFNDGDADAADPAERLSSRPDVGVLLYPVITLVGPMAHQGSRNNLLGQAATREAAEHMSVHNRVTPRTPPTFLFHTSDDPAVPVENSFLYAAALRAAGVPFELHSFEHGRHGVGLATDDPALGAWPGLCARWLAGHGFCLQS